MTDAEIIADIFGSPCDYSPIDEEMYKMDNEWCAVVCGRCSFAASMSASNFFCSSVSSCSRASRRLFSMKSKNSVPVSELAL